LGRLFPTYETEYTILENLFPGQTSKKGKNRYLRKQLAKTIKIL
jgi:hypothetical protein